MLCFMRSLKAGNKICCHKDRSNLYFLIVFSKTAIHLLNNLNLI